MRVTTAFFRLLDLAGVWVRSVSFEPDRVVVTVALRRQRLHCPKCSYATRIGRVSSITSRSGATLISASGDSRFTRGSDGCAVPSTACMWRASRSPVTAPASRATSKTSSRGWRRRPTRRRPAGWCGSTGRRSGGSSSASARSCSPADRLDDLFEISMDEVAWRKGHRVPDADRRSRPRLRGVGHRGQGPGRRRRVLRRARPAARAARTCPPRQAARRRSPAIMVPFGPCPTVPARPRHPGAWLQAGSEIEPAIFARACRLRAVSMDMTGGYAKASASTRRKRPS